jgi:hypothetical protein
MLQQAPPKNCDQIRYLQPGGSSNPNSLGLSDEEGVANLKLRLEDDKPEDQDES